MALVSDDVGLSLSFPGRHPGSSLSSAWLWENRPTCPTPPAAVHTLGSHGYSRDKIIRPLTVYGLEDAPGWPLENSLLLCVGVGLGLGKRLWVTLAPVQK